jgi:hypothetical protein
MEVFHFNSPGSSHSADNGLLAGVCVSLYVCVSPFMQNPLSAQQLLHTMEYLQGFGFTLGIAA